MSARNGWAPATPTLIYAWTEDKDEFDRIALPEMVHEWTACEATTAIKYDGQQWERRCHSKVLEVRNSPTVVFQFFDERVAQSAAAAQGQA